MAQVEHPDGSLIRFAKLWLEPRRSNDVILFSSPAVSSREMENMAVQLAGNGAWTVDGLATATVYSRILQVGASGYPPPPPLSPK